MRELTVSRWSLNCKLEYAYIIGLYVYTVHFVYVQDISKDLVWDFVDLHIYYPTIQNKQTLAKNHSKLTHYTCDSYHHLLLKLAFFLINLSIPQVIDNFSCFFMLLCCLFAFLICYILM